MSARNSSQEDPAIQKLPETNTKDVEKIENDSSNMASNFDVTSSSSDQDFVNSNRTPTSAKGDAKVGSLDLLFLLE